MKYEKEIWKDIKETDNLYQVSNFGRIKSIRTNKILSIKNSKGWYLSFHYSNAKKKEHKSFRIHRLVAKYFCENPNNYQVINHIDMNKQNNYYKNLEWCTAQHNAAEARKKIPSVIYGMVAYNKNKCHKKFGYIYQVDKKNNIINKFYDVKEANKHTNICARNIRQCLNHEPKRKTAGGYKWIRESEVIYLCNMKS